jgi:ribose 1,5-bisphosphokinase
MSGTFVAVVGPSGVGKDSLIAYARERLEGSGRVVFVRRVVTRSADGNTEDHDSLTRQHFELAEEAGDFALSWQAHSLCYGLPVGLEADLAAGRVVVANLSRAMIGKLLGRYPTAVVVEVTAEREVIAQRLASRGRETADAIRQRLDRSVAARLPVSTVQIDNSGALAVAGEQFVSLLEDLAKQPAPSDRLEIG